MFPRLLFLATLLPALLFLQAAPCLALDVTGVRLGPHPDKTRIVIELDGPAAFRSFMLADPVRLVIDTPHFNWRAGTIIKPADTGIRDIRQGPLQSGISRIVVDLAEPRLIQSAFLLPPKDSQPDRLVIDLAPASQGDFERQRSIVHGKLIVPDSGSSPQPGQISAIAGNIAQAKPSSMPAKTPVPPTQRPLIVIDAGHGGQDPGAIGGQGLKEKNITLAMARDLKKFLEATGRYRVQLVRDKDIFIRLSQRVAIARGKKADMFISLHADSINRANVRGASIYTLSEKASDTETEKLAARENHADLIAGIDLSHEDEDVANILVDLAMRDTMNQSKFFANKAVASLKKSGVQVLDNPHRFAGFAVLKAPDIPSVLIELGYMSNNQESAMLSRPEYREKIARALIGSIDGYFETVAR